MGEQRPEFVPRPAIEAAAEEFVSKLGIGNIEMMRDALSPVYRLSDATQALMTVTER